MKKTYLVLTAVHSYGVTEVEIEDNGDEEANVAAARVAALGRAPDHYVTNPREPVSVAEVIEVIEEA